MDEHNVHHYWGCSPYIDLITTSTELAAVRGISDDVPDTGLATDFNALQVCSYDARHTLATLAHVHRHGGKKAPVALYVYEETAEGLARHMLLVYCLLDGTLPARERAEMLLELHGNVMVRDKAAAYLEKVGRALENAVVALSLNGGHPVLHVASPPHPRSLDDISAITAAASERAAMGATQLFDISHMRHAERDALISVFRNWRVKVQYDMPRAWDTRCRRWYGDRYDVRRNLIDWDYHMRLARRGTPGVDPAAGSIVHFHHFRHWRLHGVAHELRGCNYTAPNRSLLSTAYGRTKDFKDRNLRDVGRSISAWGYWGEVLNTPQICFGLHAEDPRLFKVANKAFIHTSLDVAEHSILAFIKELRQGARAMATSDDDAGHDLPQFSLREYADGTTATHRARTARGPTDLANFQASQAEDKQQWVDVDQASNSLAVHSAEGQQSDGGAQARNEPAAAAQHSDVQGAAGLNCDDVCSVTCQGEAKAGGSVAATGCTGTERYQPHSRPDKAAQRNAEVELRANEAALDAAALDILANVPVRIVLLTGAADRALGLGSKLPHGKMDIAVVGRMHVHLAANTQGVLARCMAPGGVVLVEGAQYMVQLGEEQVAAYAAKVQNLVEGEVAQDNSAAPQVARRGLVHIKPPLRKCGATPCAADGGMHVPVADAHLVFRKM